MHQELYISKNLKDPATIFVSVFTAGNEKDLLKNSFIAEGGSL